MPNVNDSEELQKQYATAANLDTRASLHALFGTNPLGWGNWVFQQYSLRPGQSVLELGCGSAGIWRGRAGALRGARLLLSDVSEGMLQAARENTREFTDASYERIDAQDIPRPDASFDIVIANHMLYHAPDIDKALGEIARVLKPGGTLYATTLGERNMPELIELLRRFDPAIDFAQRALTDAFGLESGGARLRGYFDGVEARRYPDSLHITRARPLADYVLSSMTDVEDTEKFARYVEGVIARDGAIDITKDAGMLIASGR
jgi:SAM-dependent methyltransferase